MRDHERILIALDVPTLVEAKEKVSALKGAVGGFKIGMQLFTAVGPEIIFWIRSQGEEVFLDLKYKDIRDTVSNAGVEAARLGVKMFNLHIGRRETMRKTMESIMGLPKRPKCLGVTVLTDHTKEDVLEEMGLGQSTLDIDVKRLVAHRAKLAQACGLDGVISSPQEITAIREACGWDFLTVVPGTRSAGKETHDQARVDTPERAIANGADYLVIGRQVMQAAEPLAEVNQIVREIRQGMRSRVARRLHGIKSVDFDLETGWALKIHDTYPDAPKSPFYIDLRIMRSYPSFLDEVADHMVELIRASGIAFDLISDVPTAATPIAVLVSQKMGIPMISPRLDVKIHGLKRAIDGIWSPGQRVIVLDDLRTTGGSKEEVIKIYKEAGLKPVAVFVLVDRGGEEGAKVADLPLVASYGWSHLLELYREESVISQAIYDRSSNYPTELAAYTQTHVR